MQANSISRMILLSFAALCLIQAKANAQTQTTDLQALTCVRSECGSQNPVSHPFEDNPNLQKTTTDMIQKELRKPIQNYMGRIIHKSLVMDQIYKQLFQVQGNPTITSERAALIQSLRALQKAKTYGPAMEPNAEGQLSFNPSKLKALFGIQDPELEALISLETVINAATAMESFMATSSFETSMKAFYPNMTVKEAQKTEALQILQSRAALKNLIPYAPSPSDRVILRRAMTGHNLSLSEKNYFKGLIRERILMGMLLNPEIQSRFAKVPFNLKGFLQESSQSYASSSSGKAFQDPRTIKGVFNEAVTTCYQQFSYSYAAFPTHEQLQSFQSQLKVVQAQAQKMLEEKTKTSQADAFQLEIYLPPERESLVEDWKSYLEEETKDLDEGLKELKKVDLKNPQMFESMLVALANFNSDHMLAPALSFCSQAQPPFLNDSARLGANVVNFSWPTITHPEIGIGIVAHELGHIASALFDSSFMNEKSCLKGKQGSDQYVEEDFADLFSSELVNRLGRKIGSTQLKNMACGLLERKAQEWIPGKWQNSKTDNHSSSLYRVLLTAGSTTGLTKACTTYLNAIQETRLNQVCRWQK